MLPDYPQLKSLLHEEYRQRIEQATQRRLGVFSQISASQLHEGTKCILHREDGSVAEIKMEKVEASAELNHDIQELEMLEPESVLSLLDTIGERMAEQKIRHIIRRIDEEVRSVGNVIEGGGDIIEQFLEGLGKILLEFDEHGNPQLPQFIFGSQEQVNRLEEALKTIHNTPALKKRYNNIIDKKKREWRDREADRNLVE